MVSIVIKHGWFHQILGQCAQHSGFVFIALLGDLGSELEIISYQLAGLLTELQELREDEDS